MPLSETTMSEHTSTNTQPNINDDLISLAEAAELSGMSQSHIRLLVRTGKISGKKIGRNWVTTEESLRTYLATDRRPGPKSPE